MLPPLGPRPVLEDKPYPMETLRYWYVTPLGGHSRDLRGMVVGINGRALEQNTDLVPHQDTVTLGILAQARSRPVFFEHYFVVVALDEVTPDALSKSPNGEAVLPSEAWNLLGGRLPLDGTMATLILNGTASKLLGPDPRAGFMDALARVLRDRRGD